MCRASRESYPIKPRQQAKAGMSDLIWLALFSVVVIIGVVCRWLW